MRFHPELNGAKKLLVVPMLAATGLGLLMLPGGLRLSRYRRTSLDGVTNMNDAVKVCRRSGLQGWELVTFAQQLVARKFAIYSTLNLWDPPGRAFIYGMGYCTQYNLALRQILRRLGFQTAAVFALKARFFDNEEWTMGHTWLRVTIDGETRDVCSGRVDNEAGKVHFVPLSAVYNGRPLVMFLTHLGLMHFMGFLEWKALLTRTEPPSWAYEERR
jgi:hypothetical protein